ncbi:MAG TPA: class III poly(R)-hydroxyalkanoic acid synthase subunit PhaE [Rhodanobacteraceae bacterium]|nr:class III poly(R)-hydroxyalkanoic acid synthase subunit PhaE [Rhodanobacteraceae bacterium]
MAQGTETSGAPDDWQARSAQYWNAWMDATRKAFGVTAADSATARTPWHEGLEQWARLFDAGAAKDSQSEVVERLLAGARSYFALLQSLAQKGANGQADPKAWTDAVRNAFNFPGADAALLDNPLARAMRELAGQGAKGFEQMMAGMEPAMKEARSLLDLPAFGYAREHQERYQKTAKAWLDYQHETNRYNALIARASRRAFEVFEDKLAEHAEPGRQIDSVRGLYNLWVDAAEEAYAEVALSPEFREVYGALVNAQMRVRQGAQQEVERMSNDLGIPTRTEIDTLGQRLHALRREARTQTDEVIPRLVAEVAALRRELEALKSGAAAAATKNVASRKTAPRRKAPAKAAKSKSEQQS